MVPIPRALPPEVAQPSADSAVSAAGSPRGSEYAALSRDVRQAGLLDRRLRYYFWKIGLTALALVAGWTAFALIGDSWWQLGVAVYLAVVFGQLGFLGHDAGHHQVFESKRANYILGVLCGTLPTPTPRTPTPTSCSACWRSPAAGRGPAGASSGWSSAIRPICSARCCCSRGSACTRRACGR